MMICGLFSSFDPGVLPSYINYSFLNMKWLSVIFLLSFFNWTFYVLSPGYSMFIKVIMKEVMNSIKDSSSKPNLVTLPLMGVFSLIFLMNLWGLAPFFFSVSSHLAVNLSISIPLWLGGIFYSLSTSVMFFLSHMVPVGSPSFLFPLLVLVESVSIMIRPFTLSIRLMANVMAGHLIMSLIGQFISSSISLFPLSSFLMSGFLGFEMAISVVQAYVFMSLLSLYWKESEDH